MDLTPRVETFGQEDQTWLDTAHGTSSARSITIDMAKGFVQGTHYPNGYLPSGTCLAKTTVNGQDVFGLYDDTATDGRQVFVGHLFTTVKASGTVIGALYDHGRVNRSRLPFAIDDAGVADVAGRIQYV
jgi:hypothetical protein